MRPNPGAGRRSTPQRGTAVVEVRGVEPRSVKPSAQASPSAVVSERSAARNPDDEFPWAYPELALALRSRKPAGGIPTNDARSRPCGSRPGGRAAYLGSQCEVVFGTCWLFRFVNGAPETPARFQRLNTQRRNRFTPVGVVHKRYTARQPTTTVPLPAIPRGQRVWQDASGPRLAGTGGSALDFPLVIAVTQRLSLVDRGLSSRQPDLDLGPSILEVEL
jgi:hypothetical protein